MNTFKMAKVFYPCAKVTKFPQIWSHWSHRDQVKNKGFAFFLTPCCRCLVQCDQIWQYRTSLWQIFDSLFLIWQNAEPNLANL